jgi:hypothetical protein
MTFLQAEFFHDENRLRVLPVSGADVGNWTVGII